MKNPKTVDKDRSPLRLSREDIEEWRRRRGYVQRGSVKRWLIRLFTKCEPDEERISLSMLRWARISGVGAILTVILGVVPILNPPPTVLLKSTVAPESGDQKQPPLASTGQPIRAQIMSKDLTIVPPRKPGKLNFSDPDQSGLLPTIF
jgi:hypothetical protein